MNCSKNWSSYINVYNYDETVEYNEATTWDDSYVIVEVIIFLFLALLWSVIPKYYFLASQLFPPA
jgi:hypothetical protein